MMHPNFWESFHIPSARFRARLTLEKYCNKAKFVYSVMEIFFLIIPLLQLWFTFILIWIGKQCFNVLRVFFTEPHRQLEKFNGPRAYPGIGTVTDMVFTDFWEWSNGMCKKWGDPLRLWRFGHPMVFISTYKYAIQLLSQSNFNGKLKDLGMLYRFRGGSGLSTTPADKHPQKRKMLNPAFSRQIVEGSLPTFCEESIKFLGQLEDFAKTQREFDMVDPTMECLFRMVVRSDFGDNFMDDLDGANAKEHMGALHTIADNMSKRMFEPYPWLKSDFIFFNFTNGGKEAKKAADVLNDFAIRAIKGRRQIQEQMTTKETRCYLDILLDLVKQGQMTDEDVISELNNFMGGAYDTTALSVCWTLLLLALHPACQNKVFAELEEIFPKSIPHLTPAHTKRMKYLELCLKESLRLFPPAPIFPRSTAADMRLNDGRVIPQGADVLIFANLIHRDPNHFQRPNEFIPERHLDTNPAYMPFSLGVRNCIGQMYGMYQSKVVLAYLCHSYFWETSVKNADQVPIKYQGLLYPANGLHFRIKKRCH